MDNETASTTVTGGTCGSSPHPEAEKQWPLPIYIFVVNALGCTLLSILVVTVALSNRLHRRDPVVNNFLYTWILLSALAGFDQLAIIGKCNLGDTTMIREQVLEAMTMISTLNLSIHLLYIMRSAFHQSSARARKIRACLLVVTPYIIGLFPMISLFSPDTGTDFVGLFSLLVCTVTPVMDFILLIYYWRWYRKVRQTKMKGVLSVSFFVRLFLFSTYQLAYILFLGLGASLQSLLWSTGFKVVQNLFPLLAFCVIGLHRDVIMLWFPCVRFKPTVTGGHKDSAQTTSSCNHLHAISNHQLRPSDDTTRVGHGEEATMIEEEPEEPEAPSELDDNDDKQHLLDKDKQDGQEEV